MKTQGPISRLPGVTPAAGRRLAPQGAIASLAVWLLLAVPCQAVIVLPKGDGEPIRGYLVEADERQVVVDVLLPNGQTQRRTVSRDEIDQLLEAVSPARLAELTPDNPGAYREYADDLSEKRQDPDARRTALRLYLIAAYLEPDELGRGCLLAMADLAQTPAEQRRYRAMVYLLDPTHDRRALAAAERVTPAVERADQQRLLRGLRAVRSGRKTQAAAQARQEEFQRALASCSELISWSEFAAAADDPRGDLPPDLLRRVLELELTLQTTEPVLVPSPQPPRSWASIDTRRTGTIAELQLEAIAPFDPRQCVFRNGQWVAP